jgi:hypothetical protein
MEVNESLSQENTHIEADSDPEMAPLNMDVESKKNDPDSSKNILVLKNLEIYKRRLSEENLNYSKVQLINEIDEYFSKSVDLQYIDWSNCEISYEMIKNALTEVSENYKKSKEKNLNQSLKYDWKVTKRGYMDEQDHLQRDSKNKINYSVKSNQDYECESPKSGMKTISKNNSKSNELENLTEDESQSKHLNDDRSSKIKFNLSNGKSQTTNLMDNSKVSKMSQSQISRKRNTNEGTLLDNLSSLFPRNHKSSEIKGDENRISSKCIEYSDVQQEQIKSTKYLKLRIPQFSFEEHDKRQFQSDNVIQSQHNSQKHNEEKNEEIGEGDRKGMKDVPKPIFQINISKPGSDRNSEPNSEVSKSESGSKEMIIDKKSIKEFLSVSNENKINKLTKIFSFNKNSENDICEDQIQTHSEEANTMNRCNQINNPEERDINHGHEDSSRNEIPNPSDLFEAKKEERLRISNLSDEQSVESHANLKFPYNPNGIKKFKDLLSEKHIDNLAPSENYFYSSTSKSNSKRFLNDEGSCSVRNQYSIFDSKRQIDSSLNTNKSFKESEYEVKIGQEKSGKESYDQKMDDKSKKINETYDMSFANEINDSKKIKENKFKSEVDGYQIDSITCQTQSLDNQPSSMMLDLFKSIISKETNQKDKRKVDNKSSHLTETDIIRNFEKFDPRGTVLKKLIVKYNILTGKSTTSDKFHFKRI